MNKNDQPKNIQDHLALLGYRVKDKVTGFQGVCEHVGFDLYGCIQATVKPEGTNKDGAMIASTWLDVNRLEIVGDAPVMPAPDFFHTQTKEATASGDHGCADKPGR